MRIVIMLSALALVAVNMAAAQATTRPDSTATIPQYRSPSRARSLSVVPGWGYAYTGEYWRGYETWVVSVVGPLVGASFIDVPCGLFIVANCPKAAEYVGYAFGAAIIIGSLRTYANSICDAPKSAERANIRHSRKIQVAPALNASRFNRVLNAGVAVSW